MSVLRAVFISLIIPSCFRRCSNKSLNLNHLYLFDFDWLCRVKAEIPCAEHKVKILAWVELIPFEVLSQWLGWRSECKSKTITDPSNSSLILNLKNTNIVLFKRNSFQMFSEYLTWLDGWLTWQWQAGWLRSKRTSQRSMPQPFGRSHYCPHCTSRSIGK